MGGCRCTYRNCSSRSDGKIHMFHYPVFDKVRCHQWLINAQKLEFLNLKVSQLKNRVICQYHFKDENFMNFMKDKLTFDAVPTENGPFCDPSQLEEKKSDQDDSRALYLSISLDDIENDWMDKKANFSVKYGDFLTNCDLIDLDSLSEKKHDTKIPLKEASESGLLLFADSQAKSEEEKTVKKINKSNSVASSKNKTNSKISNKNKIIPIASNKNKTNSIESDNNKTNSIESDKNKTNPMLSNKNKSNSKVLNNNVDDINKIDDVSIDEVIKKQQDENLNAHVSSCSDPAQQAYMVPIEFDTLLSEQQYRNPEQLIEVEVINETQPNQEISQSQIKESKKIKILSEKKMSVTVPLSITGELEPVSPSKIFVIPKRKTKSILKSAHKDTDNNTPDIINNDKTTNIVNETTLQTADALNNEIQKEPESISSRSVFDENRESEVVSPQSNKSNQVKGNTLSKTAAVRNKIPQERIAAIAEKRKFNMKLRDIIENCLDNLDESEKPINDKRTLLQKSRASQCNKQIRSYLGEEPELPHIQDYTIAYLEARLKNMENNLLYKIDQNSQRISELKETCFVPASDKKKKSRHTQTSKPNEEQYKKQLYNDITKYLSREASSLIYEELFMQKYVANVPKLSPIAKRRKYSKRQK